MRVARDGKVGADADESALNKRRREKRWRGGPNQNRRLARKDGQRKNRRRVHEAQRVERFAHRGEQFGQKRGDANTRLGEQRWVRGDNQDGYKTEMGEQLSSRDGATKKKERSEGRTSVARKKKDGNDVEGGGSKVEAYLRGSPQGPILKQAQFQAAGDKLKKKNKGENESQPTTDRLPSKKKARRSPQGGGLTL